MDNTTHLTPLVTGENPRDVWPAATLIVEFTDGTLRTMEGIRVLGALGYRDPIVVNGTTVTVEDWNDAVFHLVGVRAFQFYITHDSSDVWP